MNRDAALPADLSPALQQYVEAIAALCRRHGHAHPVALSSALGVRMPSVTQAVGRLVARGLAARLPGREVRLTPSGRTVAARLRRRHHALRRFMVTVLGMVPHEADAAACRLEHCEDGTMFERLDRLARLLSRRHPAVLRDLARHMREGASVGD